MNTGGKSSVAVCFNYRLLLELGFRQGQATRAGVDKASYCVKRSDSTRFDTEYAQIEQDLVNLWGKSPIVGKSPH
jgi:hypothetical protein